MKTAKDYVQQNPDTGNYFYISRNGFIHIFSTFEACEFAVINDGLSDYEAVNLARFQED